MTTSLAYKTVAVFLVHCFVITSLAAPRKRARHRAGTRVAKILFEPNDPVVRPGKSTTVKAIAVDQNNNAVKAAKINWRVPKEGEGLISVSKPLNGSDDTIVIVGLSGAASPSTATDVKVTATSGAITGEILLHYVSEPVNLGFVHDSIDLAPGTKETIIAKVTDAASNELHGLNVTWKLADKKFEDLVFLGPPTNTATTNSIDVVWLNKNGQKETQIPIIAMVGTASGVATINYQPERKGNRGELIFNDGTGEKNEVSISPTEKKKISASVKRDDGTVSTKAQVECDLEKEDRDFVAISTKTDGEIALTGLGGDLQTIARTILLPCNAEGASAVLVIRYDAGSIDLDWGVLSPGIAGDNYGRTIRNDYYCIDVKIFNRSGADLTVARMRFVNPKRDVAINIPIANYKTAHGSIARRKLTHPRSMTLAIVEGVGTLMTGFNPFFHNANHAKNYSQFIDVLSNPLKSGIEKAWQDPYPSELAQFESNVLREDKILAKGGYLETTVFVPKRWLGFTEDEKKRRNDPAFVKEKLGVLEVLGYQYKQVGERTYVSK